MSKVELVQSYVAPLTTSALMHSDVESLSTGEALELWLMLVMIEKMVEERKKQLHPRLMSEAASHGKKDTTNGSFRMDLAGGSTITKERREGKQIDIDKMAALLASKEIPIEEGCDEQLSWVVSLSKVQHLIHNGKLTQQEVDDLKSVSWALKVSGSKNLKKLLDEAKESLVKGSK